MFSVAGLGEAAGRAADRWWAALPETRRMQLHRMMDPQARQDPVPEEQLALQVHVEQQAGGGQ